MDYETAEIMFGKGSELLKALKRIEERIGEICLILEDKR